LRTIRDGSLPSYLQQYVGGDPNKSMHQLELEHKEQLRVECELFYDGISHQIDGRYSRKQLDDYINRNILASSSPASAEVRAKELVDMLGKHMRFEDERREAEIRRNREASERTHYEHRSLQLQEQMMREQEDRQIEEQRRREEEEEEAEEERERTEREKWEKAEKVRRCKQDGFIYPHYLVAVCPRCGSVVDQEEILA